MSYGKMNQPIQIISTAPTKDPDGFVTKGDVAVASVRAYFEVKNSTEKWSNLSQFAEATALFRIRVIPDVEVNTTHIILHNNIKYEILSVENIKSRNMYLEIIAKAVVGSG
jgi:head-tail adaptor